MLIRRPARTGAAFALVLAAGVTLSACAQPGTGTCNLASASPTAMCPVTAASSTPSHVRTFDDELRDDLRYGGNGA